jgi:hypothetical protein
LWVVDRSRAGVRSADHGEQLAACVELLDIHAVLVAHVDVVRAGSTAMPLAD